MYVIPDPPPADIQSLIDETRGYVKEFAESLKARGKKSEYHISTAKSFGKTWDNRKYSTTATVYTGTASAPSIMLLLDYEVSDDGIVTGTDAAGNEYSSEDYLITLDNVAEGDYGRITYYRVEANGYVDGYTITADTDGNGTASASLTECGAGENITLTATANEGFKFKNWELVSGEAELKDSTLADTTFSMPAADVVVKAVFEKENPETPDIDISYKNTAGDGSMVRKRAAALKQYYRCIQLTFAHKVCCMQRFFVLTRQPLFKSRSRDLARGSGNHVNYLV